jgi:hypothetical protein
VETIIHFVFVLNRNKRSRKNEMNADDKANSSFELVPDELKKMWLLLKLWIPQIPHIPVLRLMKTNSGFGCPLERQICSSGWQFHPGPGRVGRRRRTGGQCLSEDKSGWYKRKNKKYAAETFFSVSPSRHTPTNTRSAVM